MEIVQIAVLVLPLHIAIVILTELIRALITLRRGQESARKAFKETLWNRFIEFLGEVLNPFNWI